MLIEIILLSSFTNVEDKKQNVDNYALNVDKILTEKAEKNKKEEKIVESEHKTKVENAINEGEYLNKLVQIRVNNCFVNAKKDDLLKAKDVWKNVLNDDSIEPNIKSFILDSSVVAASSDYCIITSKLESMVHLINKNLDFLTDELTNKFSHPVYFVALSENDWKKEKQTYAQTIKNGGSYRLISEEELSSLKPKVYSEIEEIAQKVFNRDKIEMV